MNFEDIVDMEWVDSETTLEASTEFSDLYFNQQLLEQPVVVEPEVVKIEQLDSLPTTEQIKQLIEIAKQQLALREQLQLLQQQNIISTELQTAAPSTIFAPPTEISAAAAAATASTDITTMNDIISTNIPLSYPATTTTSSNEQQSTADTTDTAVNDSMKKDSFANIMPDELITLEAYAEADGIDLKKLTSRERRQLRNKISARNFRVRRKEYISTLEGQVNDHKMQAEELKEKLSKVEDENKKLHKEMETLKKQNQILQQQLQQKNAPSSPRISSPLITKPNLNKDISIMGTKPSDSYRQQDNCILVSNAIMPAWDYKAILGKQIPPTNSYENDNMKILAGHFILSFIKLASGMPISSQNINNPQQQQHHHLPILPDDRDFTSSSSIKPSTSSSSNLITSSNTTSTLYQSTTLNSMEYLYDILIQSALISNSNADKSFLWY